MNLDIEVLDGQYAIYRQDPTESVSPDFSKAGFLSATITPDEFSVVCEESFVPTGCRSEPGWKCLKVRGPLDFGLTGILAGIATVLANADVSIFAVSTFDTDYILVKKNLLKRAVASLNNAGYSVSEIPGGLNR